MKEKINNYLLDKTWKKIVIIFLIVFLVIFVGGMASINYLSGIVNDNHIHSEIINVTDKMDNSSPLGDYFLVRTIDNKTYIIDSKNGRDMFNTININNQYKVVVADPKSQDINQFPHILQVYNVTN